MAQATRMELACYARLICVGGRPTHVEPIDPMDDIIED
jgi:hypothetical protein